MGIDFYDRIWEEEQKEKKRFGQRKTEIENELFELRRKVQELTEENEELKAQIEKMKCCATCSKCTSLDDFCGRIFYCEKDLEEDSESRPIGDVTFFVCDDWELKG